MNESEDLGGHGHPPDHSKHRPSLKDLRIQGDPFDSAEASSRHRFHKNSYTTAAIICDGTCLLETSCPPIYAWLSWSLLAIQVFKRS